MSKYFLDQFDTTMLPWIEKADYVRGILHTLTRSKATLFNTVEAASRNFALICASPLFRCLTITYMVSEFGLFSGEQAQRNFERRLSVCILNFFIARACCIKERKF